MSEAPPPTLEGPNNPHSPEQMMALITELHSELTAQRARIAQLTNPQATPSPSPASAPPSFIPKKNKPPTFDGKSSPDSWIAHMTSYIHGLSDQQAFSIAITYLTTDAHDWFIANQTSATAAGHPMTSWVALTEALAKRFQPTEQGQARARQTQPLASTQGCPIVQHRFSQNHPRHPPHRSRRTN